MLLEGGEERGAIHPIKNRSGPVQDLRQLKSSERSRIAGLMEQLGQKEPTDFGPKQNLDNWQKVFETATAPSGIRILAAPLDLNEMIRPRLSTGKKT